MFAKVDKEHFTGFLVERNFEGVEPGPEEKKMGLHGSSTTPVILTNAKVPDTCADIRTGLSVFCNYAPKNLLQAKRTLANAASESEKYLF